MAALRRDLADRRSKIDRRRYAHFERLITAGDYSNAIVCGEALLQQVPSRCDQTMAGGGAKQPYRPTRTVELERETFGRPGATGGAAVAAGAAKAPAQPSTSDGAAARSSSGAGQQKAAGATARSDGQAASASASGSPPAEREAKSGGSRLWFWTAVGASGAMFVAGAVMAGLAKARHSDLEQSCPDCSQADVDAGKGMALAADVLFGLGAAAAVGAVVLWFVQPGRPESATAGRAQKIPAIAVSPRGVAASWKF